MNAGSPISLLEAVKHYADLDTCHAFMAKLKWPDGHIVCPKCGCDSVGFISTRRMYKCRSNACHKQFSVKVGTIFEDSPLGLDKWFVAVWCITNAKNGISSCELARALDVTQKSAWFMLHRVRHAMQVGSFQKFAGVCESDETYVGGAASNMHLSRRKTKIHGRGAMGKAIVHGVLERGDKAKKVTSKVKATVVGNAKRTTLVPEVRNVVEAGSTVYTDALASYNYLSAYFIHESIDHAKEYVRGAVHTNGMENFWSLFKRAINGTYVSVDAPHLQRYVDEEVFRFNERKLNDGQRFAVVMPGVVGKRLTYKSLIGSDTVENCKKDEAENGGLVN